MQEEETDLQDATTNEEKKTQKYNFTANIQQHTASIDLTKK